jgi:hypothetical protein
LGRTFDSTFGKTIASFCGSVVVEGQLFPKGKDNMFSNGSGRYFGETGLMDDSSSASAEEEDEMNQETDAIEETLFEFPDSTASFVVGAQDQICFDQSKVPKEFIRPEAQIMKGYNAIPNLALEIMEGICGGSHVLPIFVHTSPILLLITNKWTRRVTTWTESAFLLKSMVYSIRDGLVPFHESVETTWPQQCFELTIESQIGIKNAETIQAIPGLSDHEFIKLMEANALHYIHCLERYIWLTLLEPYSPPELQLSDILTPPLSDQPRSPECHPMIQKYFAFKSAALAKKGVECPTFSPKAGANGEYIDWDTIMLYKNKFYV